MLEKMKQNRLATIAVAIVVITLLFFIVKDPLKKATRGFCLYMLQDESSYKKRKPITIRAERVEIGTVARRINTVGQLKANAQVTIKSEINGRIKEIGFTEGTQVRKGDLLVQFEDADFRAELAEAKAQLIKASSDLKRAKQLEGREFQSKQKLDEAQAAFDVAESKVAAAQARLAKARILAPFDGIVGLTDVHVGSYTQSAQEIVTVVDNSSMKVEFKVPEKMVNEVGVGQLADIKTDAFSNEIFQATVEAVDAKIDSESHSFAVRGIIPNDADQLKAGMFVKVSLIIGEKGNSMLVDEAAVDREGDIEFVWVVERNKASRRRVLTGSREAGRIEITAGLRNGDIVVTDGQIKLSDGAAVFVENLENSDEPEKK